MNETNHLEQISDDINTLETKMNNEINIVIKIQILIHGDCCSAKEKLVLKIIIMWHFKRHVKLTKTLEGLYCTKVWISDKSTKFRN